MKCRQDRAKLGSNLDDLVLWKGAVLLQKLLQRIAGNELFNDGQHLLILFRQIDFRRVGNGMRLQITVNICIVNSQQLLHIELPVSDILHQIYAVRRIDVCYLPIIRQTQFLVDGHFGTPFFHIKNSISQQCKRGNHYG